jgi:hypothetical protein
MQTRIIVNIAVGQGAAKKKLSYEKPDGTFVDLNLGDFLTECIEATMPRFENAATFIHPWLLYFAISPSDRRYKRNCDTLRQEIRNIILERKAGKT